MLQKTKFALLAIPAFVAATSANAAVDISGILTEISASASSVETIGVAILAVVIAIAAFMWIRRSIK